MKSVFVEVASFSRDPGNHPGQHFRPIRLFCVVSVASRAVVFFLVVVVAAVVVVVVVVVAAVVVVVVDRTTEKLRCFSFTLCQLV